MGSAFVSLLRCSDDYSRGGPSWLGSNQLISIRRLAALVPPACAGRDMPPWCRANGGLTGFR